MKNKSRPRGALVEHKICTDAIITLRLGVTLFIECPTCGAKGSVDEAATDACNHAYPSCGCTLKIAPHKPCACESGGRYC